MSNRNRFIQTQRIVFILIALLSSSIVSADLILTAPPRENQAKGNELYGPLADRLSELLGEKVVYQQPKSWADYANKMRDGYYDIIFDGPHFVAWRQKNLKHKPVVSLPGNLEFYIVAEKSNQQVNTVRDLVGKKICGMPSPHLATDLIYDIFKNPVLQPIIYEVKGGQRNSFQAFKDGKCVATIFRTTLYKRLPDEQKKDLKIITKTRRLPNQTISVSQRLHNQADAIADFLISKDGAITADSLLSRYSKRKKQFIKAKPEKFVGASDMLEGVVWGW
ncbi:phosphate/phosphite/phosphonate ABC transporter substrate-binding protein [Kaarinaea lacus]